jgi:hypothetical protein
MSYSLVIVIEKLPPRWERQDSVVDKQEEFAAAAGGDLGGKWPG